MWHDSGACGECEGPPPPSRLLSDPSLSLTDLLSSSPQRESQWGMTEDAGWNPPFISCSQFKLHVVNITNTTPPAEQQDVGLFSFFLFSSGPSPPRCHLRDQHYVKRPRVYSNKRSRVAEKGVACCYTSQKVFQWQVDKSPLNVPTACNQKKKKKMQRSCQCELVNANLFLLPSSCSICIFFCWLSFPLRHEARGRGAVVDSLDWVLPVLIQGQTEISLKGAAGRGDGGRRRRCGGEGRLFWSALSQPRLILSGLTVVCLHKLGPGWDRVPESSRTADCNKPPAGCHRRLLQSDNADIKLISVYFHPGPQWSGLARFIIKKPGLISKIKACYAPV